MDKGKYRGMFNWFSFMFMSLISMSFAIYAIYIAGGVSAMTQPLPPIVLGMIALAFISMILALISGIKMRTALEDTRLDELIKLVGEIKQIATKEDADIDKDNHPNITIHTKIDTADISSMNAEQLERVSVIIKQLQGESTKGTGK